MARFAYIPIAERKISASDGRRVPDDEGQRADRNRRIIADGERGDGDKVVVTDAANTIETVYRDQIKT